jgi:hypothetical protein
MCSWSRADADTSLPTHDDVVRDDCETESHDSTSAVTLTVSVSHIKGKTNDSSLKNKFLESGGIWGLAVMHTAKGTTGQGFGYPYPERGN